MPRRKTARTKAPSPKFEVPGLTVTKEMSKKETEEQLEIYLKDFHFKGNKIKIDLTFRARQNMLILI